MSGRVERVLADFNDEVKAGQVIAELNTDVLRLKRDQMRAAVAKARATHELAALSYRSQIALFERNLISEFELMTARTTTENLAADLAVAEANLRVTETEINQHAFVVSPIDGIVLARNISVGDTVSDASGGNSLPMFTLAENLREMQIEAPVSELDVASVAVGQPVRFSLESLPGRVFGGEVESLRLVPTVTGNVVSFTVIVRVENRDGSLLPGMTCQVEFIVERSEDVLTVPNAALRYRPTNLGEDKIADMIFEASIADLDDERRGAAIEARNRAARQNESRGGSGQGTNAVTSLMMGANPGRGSGPMIMGQPGGGGRNPGAARQGQNPARGANAIRLSYLWYIDGDGNLAVMQVRAGISDGNFTEIIVPDEMEGFQVILRERIR